MKAWKKILIIKLCIRLAVMPVLLAFHQSIALAQVSTASDAAYWNMNRALSGVTQQALASRGYVSNDPRTYATLSHMSNAAKGGIVAAAGAAAGAGAVVLAGVTAPAWASVALFIGVSAVASYGINLALDSLVNWIFRSDQKINTAALSLGTPIEVSLGGSYWSGSLLVGPGSTNTTIYGGDGRSMAYQSEVATRNYLGFNTTNLTCFLTSNSTITYWSCGAYGSWMVYKPSGSPVNCAAGMYCTATTSFANPTLTVPAKTGVTIGTAVSDIPPEDLAKPLNPQLVAAIANRLWQMSAAQPGYSGVPYPASNPISTQEATQYQQANPQVWPSVRDFVNPRTDATTNTNTTALPSGATQPATVPTTFTTSPNPATVNPASSSTLTNLGEDPVTPAPQLEQIPTAQQILNPVLNLLPNHKSFTATSQSGQCPTPTIQLYGSHTLNAHCTIIEQNKSVIQAAMTFAWAAIALFIILSA